MRTLVGLALALAVLGCGKSDKPGKGGSAKTAGGKPASGGDVSAMITGTAPTLPPEIAVVKLGAPKADTLKAVGSDSGYVPSKTNDKVTYDLNFTNKDLLEKVSLKTETDLEPILTKQWGPPAKTAKEPFWFNPATGIRAYLPDYGKGQWLAFDAYEPLETLLGAQGDAFAMAGGKPLIGMTVDELHAALGDRLCKFSDEGEQLKKDLAESEKDGLSQLDSRNRTLHICTTLPRAVSTLNSLGDQARFGLDGKLSSIYVDFPVNNSPVMIKQIGDQLDKIYGGKPVETKDDYGLYRWYFEPTAKRMVKVSLGQQSVGIDYSSYLPIADLIGGDKPGLSIETAHMPVGSFAEVKADDPAHYKQRGDEMASLYFPPTEFNSGQTEIQLEMWAHEKKTYGYRTTIHHTKNPAQGDKVFELLKAKFGEPKVDKRTTDTDKYWNFSKGGRKVEARRVSEQWQLTITK